MDAAEQLIRRAGFQAVTSRNLADGLNLKRSIVHYYFVAMDDIFTEIVRKNSGKLREKLEAAMDAEEPLRALMEISHDLDQAILYTELNVLANRRPSVRAEVARSTAELRELQTRVIAHHLEQRGITPGMEPVVIAVLVSSLAQVLALESSIGTSRGHVETMAFVDACLRAFANGQESPFAAAESASVSRRVEEHASEPRP